MAAPATIDRRRRTVKTGSNILLAVLMVCAMLFAGACTAGEGGENPFVAGAFDKAKIDAAIASADTIKPVEGVTGIIVPHHLLAADLIARGFRAASAGSYDRIVMLAPDHFRAVSGGFGTTRAGFETVYGAVETDTAAVEELAGGNALMEMRGNLSHEHGVVALMPFVKHFFPDTPVVALIAAIDTTPDQWRAMAASLRSVVTEKTLVVQSTDFSHYLPLDQAVLRDQESLGVIAANDPEQVPPLIQPDHLDTKAGLYIQMRLQREIFSSHPVVIANSNSAEYSGIAENTTSYVTAVYLRDAEAGTSLVPDDQRVVYFGGDVLLGRYLTPVLLEEGAREAVTQKILAVTHGRPLIINLEGVILDEPVAGLWDDAHLMLRELAVPVLKDIGVVAASLANNHSRDLGIVGFDETRRILRGAGIIPLEHGKDADTGAVRVTAANYIAGRDSEPALYRNPQDSGAVCNLDAAPPLVAFMHWGREYTSEAGSKERETARVLAGCGVQVIVGAHSHQASVRVDNVPGQAVSMVYSLGNLLFDQSMDKSTSALLEVRVFGSGTVFTRLIGLPNLFRFGNAHMRAETVE